MIGFVWDPLDQKWEAMFTKLKKYRQQHGDCLVPRDYKQDPSLATWVSNQRSYYSKLDSLRQNILEMIGFVGTLMISNGRRCLPSLRNTADNGDCLVPRYYKEDPSLACWVSNQRKNYSKLSSIRRDRLDSMGFVWDPYDQQWEEMFAKLEQYRQQHGDCNVPYLYKADPLLGNWVSNQRKNYSKLGSIRRDRHDSIGFVWDVLDHQWENMFAKLEKYRQQHGDCLVPYAYQYKDDPSLANWVSTQRRKRLKLDPIRRERLESIGFVWDAKHARRSVS